MMLIQAAANTWGVPVTTVLRQQRHHGRQRPPRSLTYGQLAPIAAILTPPANPTLIPDSQLRLIGKSLVRLDMADKTNGKAIFGIDVRLPGMVYAAVRHAPALGGKPSPARPPAATASPSSISATP